ncbi:hypothetical protein ACVWW1_004339 [Bradyrhizobium sp. JR3.5]
MTDDMMNLLQCACSPSELCARGAGGDLNCRPSRYESAALPLRHAGEKFSNGRDLPGQ